MDPGSWCAIAHWAGTTQDQIRFIDTETFGPFLMVW
ncbi:hypothetical protein SAMN05443247_02134 [Bradyrhizobium erythrophlei]|nr:hypothetical protein SAMN05443247_02134 [Bradyrhizobium erythrophlei]